MGRKQVSKATPAASRIGFMDGEVTIPDDFDTMDAEEIIALFEADNLFPPQKKPGDE